MYSLIKYDENMAIAYLARKFPETFAIGLRVLVELKYRFPTEPLTTMLDYGAGLGKQYHYRQVRWVSHLTIYFQRMTSS